jgi:hypothetical protein
MPERTRKKSGASLPSKFRAPIYVKTTTGIGLWQTRFLTPVEIAEQITRQIHEKFRALMRHYEILADSSGKWMHLSWCLAEELGLMTIEPEESKKSPGGPRIWLKEGDILIKRIDETIGSTEMTAEDAAKILIKKFPGEYGHLRPKSLANRYGEAKQQHGLRLSSPPAEYRAAVAQQLRQLRAKRKRGKSPNVLSNLEKYYTAILQRLQQSDE